MKQLASFGLGAIFVGHWAHEVERTLHPDVPRYAHGIWSSEPHDVLLDHVEIELPTLLPPETPPINNWRYYDVARARWNADRIARARAVDADLRLITARGVVLRSP